MMFSRIYRYCCVLILLLVLPFGPGHAEEKLLTFDDIKRISPNAKDIYIHAIIDAQDAFEANGIDSRLRAAHFLAQVMTETGGLKRIDENMNYSFNTLMRVFSRRTVSQADARRIAGKPVEVANWVYGHRLGNRGRDTMDGWNYRGSGYIQLTGRDNFLRRGSELGIDIASDPDLVRDPDVGLQTALAYWTVNNINAAADVHDRLRVRVLVNGPAAHGYAQSKAWFNKVWVNALRDKDLLGFEAGEGLLEAEGTALSEIFDEILSETGFLDPADMVTESAEVSREEAVRAFQEANGLPQTGVVDAATEDAMLDPSQWRPQQYAGEQRAAVEVTDPETTVVINLTSGQADVVPAGPFESAGSAFVESGNGIGPDAAAGNLLTGQVADRLAAANAIYPDYAPVEGLAQDENNNVINYGVIGDDDRLPVFVHMDMLAPPASSVVQIAFKTAFGAEKSCTGAMISADTVLTAAHCIHSGTIRGRPFRDFVVLPGRTSGAANFGECGALSATVLDGWINATSTAELLNYDIGAIKLDCDVGTRTGWFGVRALSDAEEGLEVTVQGYASDRVPKGQQWFSADKVQALTVLKGYHQADTFGGTSGAPVYGTAQNDMIVGVHSNTFFGVTDPWKSNNGFTRITERRVATIQNWIAQ